MAVMCFSVRSALQANSKARMDKLFVFHVCLALTMMKKASTQPSVSNAMLADFPILPGARAAWCVRLGGRPSRWRVPNVNNVLLASMEIFILMVVLSVEIVLRDGSAQEVMIVMRAMTMAVMCFSVRSALQANSKARMDKLFVFHVCLALTMMKKASTQPSVSN